MANGIIELSPEQLRAQGQEMLQLKNSYESLFQGMISDLRGINGGWSEFLAHNFEGKIAGAQKSFSGVAKMLQNGAVAAGMSANRFSSVDDVLSKFAGGLTLENIAQSTRNPTLISTLQKAGGGINDLLTPPRERSASGMGTAGKATLEMGGDVYSFAKNMTGLTKAFVTGNYVDVTANTWGLINNVYAFGADGVAIAEVGIGKALTSITGDEYYQEAFEERAEKDRKIDGFTDVLKSDQSPKWMQEIGKYTDILDKAAAGKKLYDAGEGFVKDAHEMEKVFTSEQLTNETKLSYAKDVILKNMGFSNTDYSNDTLLGQEKNQLGFFDNIKNLYDWGIAAGKGEGDKVFQDKFGLTKFGKDADEFFEDTTKMIYSWTH